MALPAEATVLRCGLVARHEEALRSLHLKFHALGDTFGKQA